MLIRKPQKVIRTWQTDSRVWNSFELRAGDIIVGAFVEEGVCAALECLCGKPEHLRPVALHAAKACRSDHFGKQRLGRFDPAKLRDPAHLAFAIRLEIVVMDEQHIGPFARFPEAVLDFRELGDREIVERRVLRISQPPPEKSARVLWRARERRSDQGIIQPVPVKARQKVFGVVGRVVMK